MGQGADTVVNDAEGTETVTVERLSDTNIRISVEYEVASGKRAAEGLQRNPSSLLPGTWEKTSDGCFK